MVCRGLGMWVQGRGSHGILLGDFGIASLEVHIQEKAYKTNVTYKPSYRKSGVLGQTYRGPTWYAALHNMSKDLP